MKNKTVLITGASRGIGAATARVFAQNGYNIVLNYLHSEEKAFHLAKELRELGVAVLPIQTDVGKYSDVQIMMEKISEEFGQLDTLVCNAGIGDAGLLTDTKVDKWKEVFRVNVDSLFYCSKLAIPLLRKQTAGQIITVSSIWGMVGASYEVAYSTAKSATIGFTKALAKELAPSNITVNCVAPGLINTDMNADLTQEDILLFTEQTPLGRIGSVEEVAESIYFLATEKAAFMTGQVLSPNGGVVI